MTEPASRVQNQPAEFLRASGLRKCFGETMALRDVDINLRSGEIVAVMGPSGSGKTTLLHCMAGILLPDSGHVHYSGREISSLSDAARTALRRVDFGFVFQFGQLIAELTAEENIALPLLLGRRPKRREALREARRWLERFGLGELASRRPGELSGGQAQRVAVARAMAHEPSVIFADEPTGSLDSASGEEVLDVLTNAARAQGAAVLLVTHDSQIAARAGRIVRMIDGRVVTGSAAGQAAGDRSAHTRRDWRAHP